MPAGLTQVSSMTDATAPGTPYLIHAYEHRAYVLPTDRPFTLGRDPNSDISINEVAVSRHHAEVVSDGNGFVLRPTGSTSTFLNGAPLTDARPLNEGDSFIIGTMKFAYTRDRLPTGMSIAQPRPREETVEGRRATLTFPTQPAVPQATSSGSRAGLWVTMLIALGVVAYIIYAVMARR